jgi:hypothetical protein
MNGKFPRPAVIIILVMVLINAGVVLYFVDEGKQRDSVQTQQIENIKELNNRIRFAIGQQELERKQRTDQNCEFAERTHLREVQTLEGTYEYLEQAENNPDEKNTILYKLIVKTLPRTIASGETDVAPGYCDESGYGLKEPDPTIPRRPDFLPESIGKAADDLKTKESRLDNQPIK